MDKAMPKLPIAVSNTVNINTGLLPILSAKYPKPREPGMYPKRPNEAIKEACEALIKGMKGSAALDFPLHHIG